MTNYTKEILSNMQTGTETADFTIEKAGGSYLINPDGYYIESNVDMDLLMNISGSEVSVNTKMTSTLKDPGKKVEITLPEDLSSYTEVSQDLLG